MEAAQAVARWRQGRRFHTSFDRLTARGSERERLLFVQVVQLHIGAAIGRTAEDDHSQRHAEHHNDVGNDRVVRRGDDLSQDEKYGHDS
jgi:hypothetical protein